MEVIPNAGAEFFVEARTDAPGHVLVEFRWWDQDDPGVVIGAVRFSVGAAQAADIGAAFFEQANRAVDL